MVLKHPTFDFFHSFEVSSLHFTCSGQTLAVSGRSRAHASNELRAKQAQLEMQLVVARVAATTAVVSEATT
jgi:hypothetical protein